MLAGVQPYSAAISVTFWRSMSTNCNILACSALLIRAMGHPVQFQFRKNIRIERIRNIDSCIVGE